MNSSYPKDHSPPIVHDLTKSKSTYEQNTDEKGEVRAKLVNIFAATDFKSDMKTTLRKNSCNELIGLKRGHSQLPVPRSNDDLEAPQKGQLYFE